MALCGGHPPASSGLCLRPCDDESDCPGGSACVAGVCSPLPPPTVVVTIDPSTRHQTLVGFGASFGYTVDEVALHPDRAELFGALFAEAGTNIIRLRNRFGHAGEEDLTTSLEIVNAATEILGARPTVLLNSPSPPSALKANGSNQCSGNPDTCTLATLPEGGFDYGGFAAHWRASVEAYAAAGIPVDYINVQNNPNWVPPASASHEACRFLPVEGVQTVTVGESTVDVTYPGLAVALAAVASQLAELATPPGIIAPEATGFSGVAEYLPHLDFTNVAAIGHHLYGLDLTAIDAAALAEVGALGQQYERPIFQTEMQADGFDTALLLHHALASIGVSAYLQNDFVASAELSPNSTALVALTADGFNLQGPYHALRHYAFFTDPGWVRVATGEEPNGLLTTAWLAPAEDALTVVLLNSAITEQVVRLDFGAFEPAAVDVVRTVFEGVEHSAELGALSETGVLRVPGRSIVTLAARL